MTGSTYWMVMGIWSLDRMAKISHTERPLSEVFPFLFPPYFVPVFTSEEAAERWASDIDGEYKIVLVRRGDMLTVIPGGLDDSEPDE